MKTDLYSRVKTLCAQRNLSLGDLCEMMHLTRQAFIASLKNNPTLSRLEEVAGHLGVEVRDLFTEEKPGAQASSNEILCPHCGKPITFQAK